MEVGRKLRFVVTENPEQFVIYCRENNLSIHDPFLRYLHSETQLRGLEKDQYEVVYYGRYWKSKMIGSHLLEGIQTVN
jgi:hypothetical protein